MIFDNIKPALISIINIQSLDYSKQIFWFFVSVTNWPQNF